MFRGSAPPRVERGVVVFCLLLLALAAWLALWFDQGSIDGFLHVHHLGHHSGSALSLTLLFVGGWTVMTVAMMLPTTLPVISTFHAIASARSDRLLLIGLVVVGYILTWAFFGGLIYLGYRILHWILSSSAGLDTYTWAGPPLLLMVAGAFQFSSLKYMCLEKCRSPFSFVIEHWQGSRYKWLSLRLGIDHGIFCVGCCWALMLLMFVVGSGSLVWMFVLAILMSIEKNVSWGRRLSTPLGIVLIGSGVAFFILSFLFDGSHH